MGDEAEYDEEESEEEDEEPEEGDEEPEDDQATAAEQERRRREDQRARYLGNPADTQFDEEDELEYEEPFYHGDAPKQPSDQDEGDSEDDSDEGIEVIDMDEEDYSEGSREEYADQGEAVYRNVDMSAPQSHSSYLPFDSAAHDSNVPPTYAAFDYTASTNPIEAEEERSPTPPPPMAWGSGSGLTFEPLPGMQGDSSVFDMPMQYGDIQVTTEAIQSVLDQLQPGMPFAQDAQSAFGMPIDPSLLGVEADNDQRRYLDARGGTAEPSAASGFGTPSMSIPHSAAASTPQGESSEEIGVREDAYIADDCLASASYTSREIEVVEILSATPGRAPLRPDIVQTPSLQSVPMVAQASSITIPSHEWQRDEPETPSRAVAVDMEYTLTNPRLDSLREESAQTSREITPELKVFDGDGERESGSADYAESDAEDRMSHDEEALLHSSPERARLSPDSPDPGESEELEVSERTEQPENLEDSLEPAESQRRQLSPSPIHAYLDDDAALLRSDPEDSGSSGEDGDEVVSVGSSSEDVEMEQPEEADSPEDSEAPLPATDTEATSIAVGRAEEEGADGEHEAQPARALSPFVEPVEDVSPAPLPQLSVPSGAVAPGEDILPRSPSLAKEEISTNVFAEADPLELVEDIDEDPQEPGDFGDNAGDPMVVDDERVEGVRDLSESEADQAGIDSSTFDRASPAAEVLPVAPEWHVAEGSGSSTETAPSAPVHTDVDADTEETMQTEQAHFRPPITVEDVPDEEKLAKGTVLPESPVETDPHSSDRNKRAVTVEEVTDEEAPVRKVDHHREPEAEETVAEVEPVVPAPEVYVEDVTEAPREQDHVEVHEMEETVEEAEPVTESLDFSVEDITEEPRGHEEHEPPASVEQEQAAEEPEDTAPVISVEDVTEDASGLGSSKSDDLDNVQEAESFTAGLDVLVEDISDEPEGETDELEETLQAPEPRPTSETEQDAEHYSAEKSAGVDHDAIINADEAEATPPAADERSKVDSSGPTDEDVVPLVDGAEGAAALGSPLPIHTALVDTDMFDGLLTAMGNGTAAQRADSSAAPGKQEYEDVDGDADDASPLAAMEPLPLAPVTCLIPHHHGEHDGHETPSSSQATPSTRARRQSAATIEPPVTRSKCTYQKLKVSEGDLSVVMVVPRCSIDHSKLKEENAEILGPASVEEQTRSEVQLVPRLNPILSTKVSRIIGAILDRMGHCSVLSAEGENAIELDRTSRHTSMRQSLPARTPDPTTPKSSSLHLTPSSIRKHRKNRSISPMKASILGHGQETTPQRHVEESPRSQKRRLSVSSSPRVTRSQKAEVEFLDAAPSESQQEGEVSGAAHEETASPAHSTRQRKRKLESDAAATTTNEQGSPDRGGKRRAVAKKEQAKKGGWFSWITGR